MSAGVVVLLCFVAAACAGECQHRSCGKSSMDAVGNVVEGVYGASREVPYRFLRAGELVGTTTKAGIADLNSGKWLLRFDGPHSGAPYPHININKQLTGVKDPHLEIAKSILAGSETAGNILTTVGDNLPYIVAAVETIRLGKAIHDDLFGKGSSGETVKIAKNVVLGNVGATAGAYAGSTIFGTVGAMFGGIGAAPGAAFGSYIGGLVGGIGGSWWATSD